LARSIRAFDEAASYCRARCASVRVELYIFRRRVLCGTDSCVSGNAVHSSAKRHVNLLGVHVDVLVHLHVLVIEQPPS
jgi:hypothetical protein